MEIYSRFFVTEHKTGDRYKEEIEGCGQEAIKWLRKDYPRFTKFVLKGFEIDGKFVPLKLR